MARRLDIALYAALLLLLAASLARYLVRHPGHPETPWIIGLCVLLAGFAAVEAFVPHGLGGVRRTLWLAVVIALWVVLVFLAPSFAWSAFPMFYSGLRTLRLRSAIVVVALLTACVVIAQVRIADVFDPSLVIGPIAIALLSTAAFVHMRGLSIREGVLAERQRLAMEIHDTIAQGISSQRMLLQAAERVWDSRPADARENVHQALEIAGANLEEARRFVRDLTPRELSGSSLPDALRGLAAGSANPAVDVAIVGSPAPVPDRTAEVLLRVAQGGLANVREHARADKAGLTLTYLPDRIVLDLRDDGVGFDPEATDPQPGKGYGLPAMRARLGRVGGTLTVESSPDGTVLSAVVPREGNER